MSSSRVRTITRSLMTLLVLLHLWPNVRHAGAHAALGVPPPPGWTWFVYLVILLLPVVGAIAIWTRFMVPALWLLALAFSSSTVFGVYHHYIRVSIDNVFHLPDGPAQVQQTFASSATAIAGLEFVTSVVAVFLCGYWLSERKIE